MKNRDSCPVATTLLLTFVFIFDSGLGSLSVMGKYSNLQEFRRYDMHVVVGSVATGGPIE